MPNGLMYLYSALSLINGNDISYNLTYRYCLQSTVSIMINDLGIGGKKIKFMSNTENGFPFLNLGILYNMCNIGIYVPKYVLPTFINVGMCMENEMDGDKQTDYKTSSSSPRILYYRILLSYCIICSL